MTVLTSAPSYLEKNLACLGERNADLAGRLRRVARAEDITFHQTRQNALTAVYRGRRLASAHRPLDEAKRLADRVDIVDNAVVVALGFGLGYHIARITERLQRTGLIIVFEPDLSLLRAVLERIDCSSLLRRSLVVLLTDAEDRAALARKLAGAEAIVAQGVTFLEHPANRARLGEDASSFSAILTEFVATAKTTLLTTLVRAPDTVRNLLWNIDHYTLGPGIADLKGAAAGFPAVIVSAGPSLDRNVHILAQPGVREKCVIVAVQTVLRPLLAAGIRPHFVTALDWHEISGRFYEGLDADDLSNVTLIADPKAHPVILDSFPGPVRCCRAPFLDHLLGDLAREMGEVPAGATVAHLAFHFARFLGCNPIGLVGQDLGFTDGLYYARDTAIDDLWAAELNPFNTIEMMEWQRVVRHRSHLQRRTDVHGRSIYTDSQMLAYLEQFERDFSAAREEGTVIIDATEGGLAKQHTISRTLRQFLDEYAIHALPDAGEPGANRHAMAAWPSLRLASLASASTTAPIVHPPARAAWVRARLSAVRQDVVTLRSIATETASLLRKMIDAQHDAAKMRAHFARLNELKRDVENVFEAFELLTNINQVGVFRRQRNDRRIQIAESGASLERQRAQLERDLDNVTWTADAADEFIPMLAAAERVLSGETDVWRERAALFESDPRRITCGGESPRRPDPGRVAVMIAIDPRRHGPGGRSPLSEKFRRQTVLGATLERVDRCRRIQSVIILAPRGFDVESLIDRSRLRLRVEVEWCDGSPFGPEHDAIEAARLWAETCWRGGIAGMSIWDEILAPARMADAMAQRGLAAAIVVGPDWPLVDVSTESGIDALVARFREHPDRHRLVFAQHPPGLSGCLISASLAAELARRTRLSTIGALLVYQPHAPQGDPIARDANVQIDHRVRRALIRATFDTRAQREALERAANDLDPDAPAHRIVEEVEKAIETQPRTLPQHLIIELNAERRGRGLFSSRRARAMRPQLSVDLAARVLSQFSENDDTILTLDGAGDPLLHPQFDRVIELAKECGVRGVHVRTELRGDRATIDRLLASPVDVVSVDFHADRAATYLRMMGDDGFRNVLDNIEYLAEGRRRLTEHSSNAAFALPWIVPRIQRCTATYEDIDPFFDRWLATLGAAVIEGDATQDSLRAATVRERTFHPNPYDSDEDRSLTVAPQTEERELIPARTSARVTRREMELQMTIRSDGAVPVSGDLNGGDAIVGCVGDRPISELWPRLLEAQAPAPKMGRRVMIGGSEVLAVIIGRAGSKGLPGKNWMPLAGRPMICHTIEDAQKSKYIDRIVVSTDGEKIAATARMMGVEVIDRPAELATDEVPIDPVVRHAVSGIRDSGCASRDSATTNPESRFPNPEAIIVILYANVPVRPDDLIDRAIELLIDSGADSVQSYCDVGKYHPWWMVRIGSEGRTEEAPIGVRGSAIGDCQSGISNGESRAPNRVFRRQDLPPLYLPDGGVIVVTHQSLFNSESFLGTNRRAVVTRPGDVIDVDNHIDARVAESILSHIASRRGDLHGDKSNHRLTQINADR